MQGTGQGRSLVPAIELAAAAVFIRSSAQGPDLVFVSDSGIQRKSV